MKELIGKAAAERLIQVRQMAIQLVEQAEESIGDKEQAARFAGVSPEDYDPDIHWPKALAKRSFDLAEAFQQEEEDRLEKAMLEECRKERES